MELKAYFSDIHRVIINHLEQAQSEVVVAVAWFTDQEIFDVLCNKASRQVKVSVVLMGDEINQGPGGLNFRKLEQLAGKIVFLPSGNRSDPIMHHKFCVIDGATVITGSYNWSRKARINDENITVVTDSESFAHQYLNIFDSLLVRSGQASLTAASVDTEAVRRRLELIRSLVLLGEQDEIAPHIHKLRLAADALGLGQLIAALNEGQYKAALEMIDDYLHKATALITVDDVQIGHLRFELLVLEVRLESLSDDKAELERRLITFNRRYNEVLGDVVQRLLKARAELAKIQAACQQQESATVREEAEEAARDAKQAYEDYSRQHEELQQEAPLPRLDEEAEQDLKRLYRKACSLCHPDKFPEERKEAAHRAFTELQDAYKSNDLERVREIHAALAAGGLPAARSATLCLVDGLKAAIAELEHAIAHTLMALKALYASDACQLMMAAGTTEASWQVFFHQQEEILHEELARLVSGILAAYCTR